MVGDQTAIYRQRSVGCNLPTGFGKKFNIQAN